MATVDDLPRTLVPPFAATVLDVDMPGLPDDVRDDAIDFVVRRVGTMPTVPRLGVLAIAAALAPLMRTPLRRLVVRTIAAVHPPLIGEYLRLVRGLLVSRVWETHPDSTASETSPDATAGVAA